MLYDVKSSVLFLTRALWLWTRLSHVYNLISQTDCDNHFSTWLFLYFSLPLSVCVLYQLLSFLLWRCFEKKIDQMWSDYRYLIFSKMSVQINAKKFSENSWETPGFSTTILHGNFLLAKAGDSREARACLARIELHGCGIELFEEWRRMLNLNQLWHLHKTESFRPVRIKTRYIR